jgi:hypothetical protein
MDPHSFAAYLSGLGLSGIELSRLIETDERTVRRWLNGQSGIPASVRLLLVACYRDRTLVGALRSYAAHREMERNGDRDTATA